MNINQKQRVTERLHNEIDQKTQTASELVLFEVWIPQCTQALSDMDKQASRSAISDGPTNNQNRLTCATSVSGNAERAGFVTGNVTSPCISLSISFSREPLELRSELRQPANSVTLLVRLAPSTREWAFTASKAGSALKWFLSSQRQCLSYWTYRAP